MSKVDVSIVIVNWNTRDLLIDCIYSIESTIRKHSFEIIVVDNASTDGSVEAVNNIFQNVNVIKNDKNLGFAKANNIGLRLSIGRYYCLVNSDIIALKDSLDSLINFLDSHHHVGAIGPLTYNEFFHYRPNCRDFPNLKTALVEAFFIDKVPLLSNFLGGRLLKSLPLDSPSEIDVLSGCFFCFRSDLCNSIGLLDENFFIYGEDKDYCKRIKNKGFSIIFYPLAKVIHIAGASSSKSPIRFQKEMLKSNTIYWKKHYNKRIYKLFKIITIIHYMNRTCFDLIANILFFWSNSNRNKKRQNIKVLRHILNIEK